MRKINRSLLFGVLLTVGWAGAAAAQWQQSGNKIYYNEGNVGIGTANPSLLLEVSDPTVPAIGLALEAWSGQLRGSLAMASANGYFCDFATRGDVVLRSLGGDVIITTFEPDAAIRFGAGQHPNNSELMTITEDGDVGIGFLAPQARLDVAGRTRTEILEITGGMDLAEPFAVVAIENIEPGTVLSIDPDNPGRLRISDSAYDLTVAGVVSGAGGVRPGVILNQGEVSADLHKLVALTGRVWVRAETSNGAIRPGDLLTTSNLPGQSMKVTDFELARGAILGKAMTSLENDSGLVLALVSLQ